MKNDIYILKRQGKTIVFVTHALKLVKRLCDRAIFIPNGKIQKIGRADG